MSETALSQKAPATAAEYEAEIERLLSGMAEMNRTMEADREEINRLRAETQALKTETRSLLSGMGVTL